MHNPHKRLMLLMCLGAGIAVIALVLNFIPVICLNYYSNHDSTIWKKQVCLLGFIKVDEEFSRVSHEERILLGKDDNLLEKVTWNSRGGFRKNIYGKTLKKRSS